VTDMCYQIWSPCSWGAARFV